MSDDPRLVEYLKRVTAELYETRARLRDAEANARSDGEANARSDGDPVVVVGVGCRFPGGVASADDLWDLVARGGDAVSDFPADRGWDLEGLFDLAGDDRAPFAMAGGFVREAAGFDAAFFGISPREALVMDPQQRLFLEVVWHGLESAGIDPAGLAGGAAGVFAGVMGGDYASGLAGVPHDLVGLVGVGNAAGAVSGRAAYALGVHGPAISVDTACSSSLVAVHLAVAALRRGECDLAVAGGVTVMSSPARFAEFWRQGGLAPDGRCKAFAAEADGTAWAEGAGVVVLERLSAARAAGHRVWAVVAGSAVNQDGASNGFTAPSGRAQEAVIRAALADAGVRSDEVDVVEAHGTGTRLGDPIEAAALAAAYGRGRDGGRPLWLGSVKSNLGHTQAAAGVAGMIKMMMAMRHGTLPASLHIGAPTPHADWDAGIRPLTEPVPWPATGRPRRAGVSAFGVSGTNAHLILQEGEERAPAAGGPHPGNAAAPSGPTRASVTASGRWSPWVLSGASGPALAAQARALREHLARLPEGWDAADVAYSLATTRTHHPHRAAIVGRDRDDLFAGLAALAAGDAASHLVTGHVRDAAATAAFLFPGQGAQWRGMGVELLDSSPAFRDQMAECEKALAPYADWSPVAVLRGDAGAPSMDRVDILQPVSLAVTISLAALWLAYGVRPAAVAGHSQGEIAAAWLAGALSLSDAMMVAALRGRALARLSGLGGMASVGLPEEQARELALPWRDRLTIGAVNGPRTTVLSGDQDALAGFLAECASRGVRAQRIPVDYASHSPQVERIRDEVLRLLAPVAPTPPELPFVSGVTGQWADPAVDRLDARHWYRSLREPVRFDRSVATLLADGHRVLIEVGPHPVLAPGVRETIDESGVRACVLGTLRRDDGGLDRFLCSLAEAHVGGVPLDWHAVFEESGAHRMDLPGYAFQRERYWLRPVLPAVLPPEAPAPTPPPVRPSPPPPRATEPGTEPGEASLEARGEEPGEASGGECGETRGGVRGEELARLVGGHLAAVLRYPSLDGFPSDATFRDLGLESTAAVELRNRIAIATGVELRLTDVLNYPTVRDLAERLEALVSEATSHRAPPAGPDTTAGPAEPQTGTVPTDASADAGADARGGAGADADTHAGAGGGADADTHAGAGGGADADADRSAVAGADRSAGADGSAGVGAAGVSVPAAGGGGTEGRDSLVSLYLRGVESGRANDAMRLVRAAARLRDTFGPNAAPGAATLVRTATGSTRPALVCAVPPVAPITDVAYSFLASALPEPRDVWTLWPPGFSEGRPLPADLPALFNALRSAIEARFGPAPVVLAGYSSGGWIARGLAEHLEAAGRPAAAVVLFDIHLPVAEMDDVRAAFMREQARRRDLFARDARSAPPGAQLSAMGGYVGLFDGWAPTPIGTPTLHLRASRTLPGVPATAPEDQFPGRLLHTSASLPGDHFTLLSQHAAESARAMHDWLAEVL
ncbi:type I polyketide synthase [Sphaerisporangium dianthi]|uniref:Type I polyketide synthase n=1 Tax=Sphaerisporangium dianthi TaxID=1436120 RepID=A0ABV9CJ63_9ACTN